MRIADRPAKSEMLLYIATNDNVELFFFPIVFITFDALGLKATSQDVGPQIELFMFSPRAWTVRWLRLGNQTRRILAVVLNAGHPHVGS